MMKLTIVIPCYNEEQVLPWTLGKLATLIDRLKKEADTDARLLLVDDGSHDRTWQLICEAAKTHDHVNGIRLSHNEGHQSALWAGMQESVATSDAVASIDADLQDDETVMIDMARQINEGKDIVYGVRKKRETDTWFKRFTAQSFYKLMKSMDSEIVYNHADFRMMSRRAVEALMRYPERNLFLRGIVRRLGFNEGYVYYDRRARTLGESKYPLKKMLAFSVDGITSFSTAPLKFITFIGLAMTLISLVMIVFGIVRHMEGNTIEGWTSLLVSLWFIGGMEVKQRPRYFVQERV